MITAFRDIYEKKDGKFISVDTALSRIRDGKSAEKVNAIRSTNDRELVDQLKKSLPSMCFSGKFSERFDNKLIQHSGYICCDLDDVPADELQDMKTSIADISWVKAVWVTRIVGRGYI